MKQLFSSPDSAQMGLFRSRLEAAGIACEMRNEHLSPAMPGAPFDPEPASRALVRVTYTGGYVLPGRQAPVKPRFLPISSKPPSSKPPPGS